ncbi:MAG: hypothetical protein EOO62_30560, partial [Hymenobacter sp.]
MIARVGLGQAAAPAALAQAAKLEATKQYEAAYQVLNKADPKDQQPVVFLQKEKILLDYYLITLSFQGFGLKNLGPKE